MSALVRESERETEERREILRFQCRVNDAEQFLCNLNTHTHTNTYGIDAICKVYNVKCKYALTHLPSYAFWFFCCSDRKNMLKCKWKCISILFFLNVILGTETLSSWMFSISILIFRGKKKIFSQKNVRPNRNSARKASKPNKKRFSTGFGVKKNQKLPSFSAISSINVKKVTLFILSHKFLEYFGSNFQIWWIFLSKVYHCIARFELR